MLVWLRNDKLSCAASSGLSEAPTTMSVDWTMFQGEPAAGRPSNPLDCRVVNYNREVGEGRVYFTVIIR